MAAEEISFAQFFFWNGIGAVGLGGYIWYDTDKKWKRAVGIVLTFGGVLCSVLAVSKVNAFLLGLSIPSVLGPLLLLVGWGIIAYDVYLKRRIISCGPEQVLNEGYNALRAENDRLKIELKEQREKVRPEGQSPLSLENYALKARLAEMKTFGPPTPTISSAQRRGEPAIQSALQERIFVNEQPAFFNQLLKEHTSVQAETLLQPYLGKWMRLSSFTVDDIDQHGTGHVLYGVSEDGTRMTMFFDGRWAERILILRKGSRVDAVGQIYRVELLFLRINNCELLDPATQI